MHRQPSLARWMLSMPSTFKPATRQRRLDGMFKKEITGDTQKSDSSTVVAGPAASQSSSTAGMNPAPSSSAAKIERDAKNLTSSLDSMSQLAPERCAVISPGKTTPPGDQVAIKSPKEGPPHMDEVAVEHYESGDDLDGPTKALRTSNGKRRAQVLESSDFEQGSVSADEMKSPPKKKSTKTTVKVSPSKSTLKGELKPAPIFAKPAKKSKATAVATDDDNHLVPSEVDREIDEHEAAEDAAEQSDEDDDIAENVAALDAYHDEPKSDKWAKGQPVPYQSLVHTFSLIEATTKRLEISKYLTQFLMRVIERTPDELIKVIYLCINRLCPDYEGVELGIGESLLVKAIGESMGRSPAQVKADYKRLGDLGMVAKNSRGTQKTMFKPKPLLVKAVFADLKAIATTSGNSSQAKKVGIITKMLAACQGEEAKFIIRSCEGRLRIGLAERTVLVALAHAAIHTGVGSTKKRSKDGIAADLERGANTVKAVFSELPSYDLVIPALLSGGTAGLRKQCKLTTGVPLKPMLAKPTKAITEVLDRFEGKKFTCEYKYDGERAQIHFLEDGSLSVFSRNSENMSVKYPDMVEQLPRAIQHDITRSFVLDAEAVAWDRQEKKILPFQDLSRRKRKDVKTEDITVKVNIFAFDLLFLNGEPLINTPLANRRALLRKHFREVEGEFSFATSTDAESVEEIQSFLDESVKGGCEGLMVKMLEGEDAHYEPSRRSMNWLKLKKDYLAGLGDSFDLVVIGGYWGRGKRTSVYGSFLLACYDAETETYQAICKIATGFSEEDLEKHYQLLKDFTMTAKKGYYDAGEAKPDIWFEPKVVWEVLAADLSLSPVYNAAKGLCAGGERGVSLRFPRYIKQRDDKGPEDATGPEQVAEMYNRQVTAQQSSSAGRGKRGKEEADGDFW